MIKAFIEIPMHSRYKYELDKDSNTLILDRPLNQIIPANYGFIVDTLAPDKDPLDIFIITKYPLAPGSICKVNVIGIMKCTDNGTQDDKIIATLVDENKMANWSNEIEKISTYLKTYKTGFEYIMYSNELDAMQEIETCQKTYMSNKYPIIPDSCKYCKQVLQK
jgi:inorganic pyrophosphatase